MAGSVGLLASTQVWTKTLLELGPSSPLAKDFHVLIGQYDPKQRDSSVKEVHYDAQKEQLVEPPSSSTE
jgi:hypothetical protein